VLGLALGKSLAEIGRMTPAEIESWRQFYIHFPFDDFHRYHRPAAYIASAQVIRDRPAAIDSALEWLQPEPIAGDWSEADLRTMKALGVKPPRD